MKHKNLLGPYWRKRFDSVADYLASLSASHAAEFYDNGELAKIGRACGITVPEVRAALKKCGYVQSSTVSGQPKWIRGDRP
jgi:hypothetical protein